MTERPVDVEAVAHDDQLLDALGAGLAPSTADPAIRALYAWRSDLAAGVEDFLAGPAAANVRPPLPDVRRAVGTARVNGRSRANGRARVNGAASVGIPPTSPLARPDRTPAEIPEPPRRGRRRAAAAAAIVGLTAGLGGVAVAAAEAEPGSPLWPITKVVFSEAAEDRQAEAAAESALEKARRALAEGRVDDAERYLDEAKRHAGEVDSGRVGELHDELDAVRDEIDESGGDGASPRPGDSDDPEDVVPSPSLPSPHPKDAPPDDEGADGERGRDENNRGGKEGRDGNDNTDASASASTELSLILGGLLGTKPLPEF